MCMVAQSLLYPPITSLNVQRAYKRRNTGAGESHFFTFHVFEGSGGPAFKDAQTKWRLSGYRNTPGTLRPKKRKNRVRFTVAVR